MRMERYWGKRVTVIEALPKLIHGGDGFSGIVLIASVPVMNKANNQIDISV